jgi:phage shock protein A
LAALGLAAVQAGLAWFLAGWAKSAEERTRRVNAKLQETFKHVDQLSKSVDDRDRVIKHLKDRSELERNARQTAEAQRDKAVQSLVETGDPQGIAVAIRHQLGRLRDLSDEMPTNPTAKTDPAANPLHGPDPGTD